MWYEKVTDNSNSNVWYAYPNIKPETEGRYLVFRDNGFAWYDDAYWVNNRSKFNEDLPSSPGWIKEYVLSDDLDEYYGVNTTVKAWRPYPGLGEIKGV